MKAEGVDGYDNDEGSAFERGFASLQKQAKMFTVAIVAKVGCAR
jgi:hypothetical protein